MITETTFENQAKVVKQLRDKRRSMLDKTRRYYSHLYDDNIQWLKHKRKISRVRRESTV